jgi:RimJ/RimL family protein N-acetyltransferase
VLLRPISAALDAAPLHRISHPPDGDPSIWTYLSYGPYASAEEYRAAVAEAERSEDPLFFAIVPLPGEHAAGQASFLRMKPELGSIEIGHIWFGRELRRTRASTEAILLLAEHAFERLGYRRLEWSCNALNAASRRAAERFGFTYEGTFRRSAVVKGRSRDNAWFSITADEWPAARARLRDLIGHEK